MILIAYDEYDRRFFSLTLLILVALAAVVVAVGVSLAMRPSAQRPSAATTIGISCSAALRAADRALGEAQQVEQNMSSHTSVMNDLLAGRITTPQALDRGMPSLIAASQHSTRLDQDIQDYRLAAPKCH